MIPDPRQERLAEEAQEIDLSPGRFEKKAQEIALRLEEAWAGGKPAGPAGAKAQAAAASRLIRQAQETLRLNQARGGARPPGAAPNRFEKKAQEIALRLEEAWAGAKAAGPIPAPAAANDPGAIPGRLIRQAQETALRLNQAWAGAKAAGNAPGAASSRLVRQAQEAALRLDKALARAKAPGAAQANTPGAAPANTPGALNDESLPALAPGLRTVKLTLAYDGSRFRGWQRQAQGPTLQEALESALAKLCGHKVAVQASGRTDAGVHARGQVASFLTCGLRSLEEIVRGGNALLPSSMAILKAEEAEPGFSARFSCKGKTYAYDFLATEVRDPLLAGRSWFVGPNLDWEAVEAALPLLLGERDFASFQSSGGDVKTTVRTITEASLTEPEERLLRLTITGSGFLRHMVRTIAGTLWLVGRHKLTPGDFEAVIASKDRSKAGPVAPPQGLRLERAYY
jgi:tRNA pseudouridine38-40 synthase